MIITRTPFRISYAGGGTDIPAYYKEKGGAIISAAINKYVYVTVNEKFDGKIHLRYSKIEMADDIDGIEHSIIRETMRKFGIKKGIEITTISDIPMKGTGLGSSSSLCVGLVNALAEYIGIPMTRREIAETACDIEINVLGNPIGKQDQYAAAFGGLNFFEFKKDGEVVVSDMSCIMSNSMVGALEDCTALFYLNAERDASKILSENKKTMPKMMGDYDRIMGIAKEIELIMREASVSTAYGDYDKYWIRDIGKLMSESWEIKRRMSQGVSNEFIDSVYGRAIKAGAIGGKVSGAGGGGFMMMIVMPEDIISIEKSLPETKRMEIGFDFSGTQIIHDGRQWNTSMSFAG